MAEKKTYNILKVTKIGKYPDTAYIAKINIKTVTTSILPWKKDIEEIQECTAFSAGIGCTWTFKGGVPVPWEIEQVLKRYVNFVDIRSLPDDVRAEVFCD